MGTIQLHALLVTRHDGCRDLASLGDFRRLAVEAMGSDSQLVGPVIQGTTNGYETVLVAPCGSKLGWGEADMHDSRLSTLVTWLRNQVYDDGSSPFKWALVSYGELGAGVVHHNCEDSPHWSRTFPPIEEG